MLVLWPPMTYGWFPAASSTLVTVLKMWQFPLALIHAVAKPQKLLSSIIELLELGTHFEKYLQLETHRPNYFL